MIAEFTAHNVALVVPDQGIDTSGANSAAPAHGVNILPSPEETPKQANFLIRSKGEELLG